MGSIVLDASVTMTWCYPDENSEFAYRVMDALVLGNVAMVPNLWTVEVANAVLVGERRKRLNASEVAHFFEMLQSLPITTDSQTSSRAFNTTLQLARACALSLYDATYLELAMREGCRLATLDQKLRAAAAQVGLELFY